MMTEFNEDMCCICLQQYCDDFESVFANNSTRTELSPLGHHYEELFQLSIATETQQPHYLCSQCSLQLKQFHKFRTKAITSYGLFSQFVITAKEGFMICELPDNTTDADSKIGVIASDMKVIRPATTEPSLVEISEVKIEQDVIETEDYVMQENVGFTTVDDSSRAEYENEAAKQLEEKDCKDCDQSCDKQWKLRQHSTSVTDDKHAPEELIHNDDKNIRASDVTQEQTTDSCLFCNKIRIQRKGKKIHCHKIIKKNDFLNKIKTYATEINDLAMLLKIDDLLKAIDTKPLAYHGNCQLDYYSKYKKIMNEPDSNQWALTRDYNKIARATLIDYIQEEVLRKLHILSLSHLKIVYVQILNELYQLNDIDCTNMFSTTTIKEHIENTFKKKIEFVTLAKKVYIKSSTTVDINSYDDEQRSEIMFEQEAEEFAMKYRNRILKIGKKALPDYIDSESLDKGECEIPRWLNNFWVTALCGVEHKCNERTERLASCYSQDSIYSITRGNIKPSKQILLGITMKNLTGSQKVINILSEQGYCLSYSSIVELETSAAASNQLLCPSGIYPTPILTFGVARDNFDRFVETTSGKSTLHDTVGVAYQNVPIKEELDLVQSNGTATMENQHDQSISMRDVKGSRKRSFEPENDENLP